jgi:hypothetical protein
MEVPVPGCRQIWPTDCLHAGRAARCWSSLSLPAQSSEDDERLSTSSITTDKLASYPKAIRRLKREGSLPKDVEHRTSKYLNNIIEADHGAFKCVIRPARGFQRMKTASATIGGFEVMRMIRRGHCVLRHSGVIGEIRLVSQLFGLATLEAVPVGSL